MKFIDSIVIHAKAGDGGPGMVSFRSAKNMPKQGPDGGDGGFGGDVYLCGDHRLNTLSTLKYKHWYKAEHGARGGSNDRTGKDGVDLIIPVPLGTVAINEETGAVACEALVDGEKLLVCKGGKRGLGNARYLSSVNQAPTQNTGGGTGDQATLRLELKLLADVGLAGFPNAGKSTLVSVMTKAKPKIADYPFTTLVPQLGVVDIDDVAGGFGQSFVIADIPGLIEGAHAGKGLGHEFLKHLERTQLIVYILDGQLLLEEGDAGEGDASVSFDRRLEALLDQWRKLQFELKAYSPILANKEFMIVVNKSDLFSHEEGLVDHIIKRFNEIKPGTRVISGVAGDGITDLKLHLFNSLEAIKKAAEEKAAGGRHLRRSGMGRVPELIMFGGTFDPPHRGHIDCIRAAVRRFPGSKVLVMPAFSPPLAGESEGEGAEDGTGLRQRHDPGAVKTPALGFDERVRLVDQCLRFEFADDDVHLSTLESKLPVPSYTRQTLQALSEQGAPGKSRRLALLVGEDQLESFHRWNDPVGILKLADLLVVRRRHKFSASLQFRDIRQSIERLVEALGLDIEWDPASPRVRLVDFDGMIDVLDVDAMPAESTLIRQYLRDGQKVPAGWIPSYLLEIIDKNNFYR